MLVIFHALNENEGNLNDEKNQQLTFELAFIHDMESYF